MVENAVENDAYARLVKFFHQRLKLFVGTETAVNFKKVDRVIPVPLAFKERIEQHGIKAAILDICDLLLYFAETMAHFAKVVFPLRPAIAERIDLIKYAFVKPHVPMPLC